jgi:hypothetical protein
MEVGLRGGGQKFPEPVLISDAYSSNDWHGQKYIAFGPDGKLWVPGLDPCPFWGCCHGLAETLIPSSSLSQLPDSLYFEDIFTFLFRTALNSLFLTFAHNLTRAHT